MAYETKDGKKKFGSAFLAKRYDEQHPSDGGSKNRVFVMRHGQTALDPMHRSDGWLDLPLSDLGRQSVVKTLSDHLSTVPIVKIHCADLKRTEETSEILKSGMSSDPSVKPSAEAKTWDLGELSGNPKKPNKPIVLDLLENPDKKAPDGESYQDFKDRFDKWFNKRLKEVKEKGPILLVLSGSNCRRIGELLLNDRDATDVNEAGLFVLQPEGSKWSKEILCGKSESNEEAS